MTYIDSIEIIYNIQVWFRRNRMNDLPNDDVIWAKEFRQWLYEQGCQVVLSEKTYIHNALEIAPGYDRLKFERDEDATSFLLRWS